MINRKVLSLFALLAAFSFLPSCSSPVRKAGDGRVVITQVPLAYFNDSTAATYLSDLRKGGVSVVLVSLEDVFVTGAEREALLERLGKAIGFFAGEGFQVGVWTNSLGYGYHRPELEAEYPGLMPLTDFDGNTGGAICSTDTLFLGLIRKNVQDFARSGARFILMDDDLVQGVRPGFACACPNHLALLKEATGKDFTREQVKALFTGPPSADRTAYLDVLGKSMTDFCRSLREAVDEVDPGIVMGICASYTHFDAEGVDMEELVRLLAGEGHTPFLRLSGATYWPAVAPRFPGQTLGDVADFVRMQAGWYRDRGIVLFDENDPYPRKSEIVPAAWCELYDKIMIANGGVNRHKYMCCYDPADPDRAYVEAHLADLEDDRALEGMFAGTEPCGFRVWNSEHLLRDVTLPEEYPGNGPMMVLASHSSGAAFLGANSIPVRFEGSGGPGIAFGDQARLLPEEAIGSGLILDVPAALALASRGVDVGLLSARPVPSDSIGGTSYELTPREDVESQVIDPSCLVCKTRDGIFAIYGWDGYEQLSLPSRHWQGDRWIGQLKTLYRILSGGEELPAALSGSHPLYLLAALSPDGSRLSLLLCNLGEEPVGSDVLDIPEGWKVTDSIRPALIQGWNWCALSLTKDK